jgi:ribosomal protein S19
MTRSIKPFVANHLLKKLKNLILLEKVVIKTWSRSSMIVTYDWSYNRGV